MKSRSKSIYFTNALRLELQSLFLECSIFIKLLYGKNIVRFFVHHGRMFVSIDREKKKIEKEFLIKVGFTKRLINYEYLL